MNRYALGLVESAEATMIIIPLNSNITINGYMDKKIPYHKVTVMVNQSTKTCIPDDVQATLHPYVYEDYQVFRVTINNVTTRTLSIPPKAVVCEIEPADIENFGRFFKNLSTVSPKMEGILSQIHIPYDNTYEERQACRDLVESF